MLAISRKSREVLLGSLAQQREALFVDLAHAAEMAAEVALLDELAQCRLVEQ